MIYVGDDVDDNDVKKKKDEYLKMIKMFNEPWRPEE